MPRFGHKGAVSGTVDLLMEIAMTFRPFAAVFGLAVILAGTSGARAEIVLGGSRYPDAQERAIIEACRGLEAQSRMSLTSNVPDDIESADPSSEYALSNLPFTLRDCREADLI
jgi:hypothetical protein